MRRVFETVRDTLEFKYNCTLVLIDFFVRHGMLSADDPDFIPIVAGLRRLSAPRRDDDVRSVLTPAG